MKLSIIIPCMNEEGNVISLYKALNDTLKGIKYEAIYINDGSKDKTYEKLEELYNKDMQHIKVLSFSRNFGKEAAMLAGLESACGEYTCIIDADLQQNPKYLLEMFNFLEENKDYDEVAMVMENINHGGIMNLGKNCFYNLMNKLCDIKLESAASDFRMFRTNVKKAMISLGEKNRFTKGVFSWVGFNVKYLPYQVEPRKEGTSSFGFIASMKYAFTGILAFSTKPLNWAFTLGILSLVSFFIYLIVLLVQVLGYGMVMNASYIVILLLLFMFGMQFLLIGIIGAYISKINLEVKNRPMYVVKKKLGFNDETIL